MSEARRPYEQEDNARLVALAEEAVAAFREESPEAYAELVEAFDGRSASLALLSHGHFTATVEDRELRLTVEPEHQDTDARGAVAPETLLDIVEGRLTPLEAYFKGDLIAQADSADLHHAYNYFVKFADLALRSQRLQAVLARFREQYGL